MIKALRLSSVCCNSSSKQQILSHLQKNIQLLAASKKISQTTMAASSSSTSSTATAAATTAAINGKSENLEGIVKFLELVGDIKHLKRTGWVLRNVNDCESVAGHMYRMSIMTFLLDGNTVDETLDRSKCLELALVHDLAECIVGDITPYCGVSRDDKKEQELSAMRKITKLIEPRGERLMKLFLEYEENETPESKFVKDLDRLDLVLQAFEYEKRDNCPQKHQEFFDSTEGKINHPFVQRLVDEIKAQREATSAAGSHDEVRAEPSATSS